MELPFRLYGMAPLCPQGVRADRQSAGASSDQSHEPGSVIHASAGTLGYGSLARRLRRSDEHTSELQSRGHLVCRILLEKKTTTSISTFEAVRHRGVKIATALNQQA